MPQTVKLTEFTQTQTAAPWMTLPATQQPHWHHHPDYDLIEAELSGALPLVAHSEIREAKRALGLAALGEARVLQLGDCAESFSDADQVTTSRKVRNIGRIASRLAERTGQQVARFGRMAGQYAKPRSSNFETIDGVDLPSFRGELVNSSEPGVFARRHDPERMLQAYDASAAVIREVRAHWSGSAEELSGGPWVAHEALVLDYENALIRTDERTGEQFLTSTHFPWIGERTRQLENAHVNMFSAIANPIGVKVGPTADPETVVRLCQLLDPHHTPGRLTLIVRMGREDVHVALPLIVRAVRRAGHPVVWISDPMHGNTVTAESGRKTRHVTHIIEEATAFRHILETEGAHAAGLHLEVAATDVTECVGGSVPDENALSARYETLCDPRLNPEQALGVIDSVF
ncbi:3-deoxy-7-phosphoheptulonate synthase [Lentzea sp. NPDC092896]|uniref:3-deoxy-7-phosphoheptulonate synthase n=1 Tax=Lentzea sp. NPDC092896 TaxID=3364127 RepID=UPI0037F11701